MATEQKNKLRIPHPAVFALISFAVAYWLGSWSIDSGSIILYALTAISTLYGLYFSKEWIKSTFLNDEHRRKTSSSGRAKKAH
jgi:hypothetical protein